MIILEAISVALITVGLPLLFKLLEARAVKREKTYQELIQRITENDARDRELLHEISNINRDYANQFQHIRDDLTEHKKTIRMLAQGVARIQLFDKNLDVYSRLDAGIEYMRYAGNGKAKNELLDLANNNPDAWDTVCRNNEALKNLNSNYFEDSMSDINKLLDHKQKVLK